MWVVIFLVRFLRKKLIISFEIRKSSCLCSKSLYIKIILVMLRVWPELALVGVGLGDGGKLLVPGQLHHVRGGRLARLSTCNSGAQPAARGKLKQKWIFNIKFKENKLNKISCFSAKYSNKQDYKISTSVYSYSVPSLFQPWVSDNFTRESRPRRKTGPYVRPRQWTLS